MGNGVFTGGTSGPRRSCGTSTSYPERKQRNGVDAQRKARPPRARPDDLECAPDGRNGWLQRALLNPGNTQTQGRGVEGCTCVPLQHLSRATSNAKGHDVADVPRAPRPTIAQMFGANAPGSWPAINGP